MEAKSVGPCLPITVQKLLDQLQSNLPIEEIKDPKTNRKIYKIGSIRIRVVPDSDSSCNSCKGQALQSTPNEYNEELIVRFPEEHHRAEASVKAVDNEPIKSFNAHRKNEEMGVTDLLKANEDLGQGVLGNQESGIDVKIMTVEETLSNDKNPQVPNQNRLREKIKIPALSKKNTESSQQNLESFPSESGGYSVEATSKSSMPSKPSDETGGDGIRRVSLALGDECSRKFGDADLASPSEIMKRVVKDKNITNLEAGVSRQSEVKKKEPNKDGKLTTSRLVQESDDLEIVEVLNDLHKPLTPNTTRSKPAVPTTITIDDSDEPEIIILDEIPAQAPKTGKQQQQNSRNLIIPQNKEYVQQNSNSKQSNIQSSKDSKSLNPLVNKKFLPRPTSPSILDSPRTSRKDSKNSYRNSNRKSVDNIQSRRNSEDGSQDSRQRQQCYGIFRDPSPPSNSSQWGPEQRHGADAPVPHYLPGSSTPYYNYQHKK